MPRKKKKDQAVPQATPADSLAELHKLEALWNSYGSGLDANQLRFTPRLPLGSIRTAESVWQPRIPGGSEKLEHSRIKEHVADLAAVIKDTRKPLDPITVLPIAVHSPVCLMEEDWLKGYYALDGHMRLAAYAEAGWKPQQLIPIRLYKGTFRASLLFACSANSLRKLSLTKKERKEIAWRLIGFRASLPPGHPERPSLRQVNAAASLSYGTVQAMAKVWEEGIPGRSDDPKGKSWAAVEYARHGLTEEQLAEDEAVALLALRIGRQLGKSNPRYLGRALRRVFFSTDLQQLIAAASVSERTPSHPTTEDDDEPV